MADEIDAVLWTGSPKHGLMVSARDWYLIPFSLAWCGFAVFWTVTATAHSAPVFFILWGLMFVSFGMYFVFGRFIHDSIIRSKITYTVDVTGVSIANGSTVTTIPAGHWTCLEITRYGDRTGTIRFAPDGGMIRGGNFGIWVPSLDKTPQFYRIQDPDHVLGLIQGLARH